MRLAAWMLGGIAALRTGSALADGEGAVAAEALFREARKDADVGRFDLACPKFAESYRLDPAPGTLLNLGDCQEARGKLASAWLSFHKLAETLPPRDERRAVAHARYVALEPKLPTLRIVLESSSGDDRVLRDGVELGQASMNTDLPVDPGGHEIVVQSAGHQDASFFTSVAAGEHRTLLVHHGDQAGRPQRTAGLVLVGLGLGAAAAGTGLGIAALVNLSASNAACTGNTCESQEAVDRYSRARSFGIAADVSFAAAIVMVGAGIVLALTSPRDVASRVGDLSRGVTF